jgi:hypothetical protein
MQLQNEDCKVMIWVAFFIGVLRGLRDLWEQRD